MEKDCIEDHECEKCKAAFNAELDKLQGQYCDISNPRDGALGVLHEKINTRVSYFVFIFIIGILVTMIAGSYNFTKDVNKDVADIKTQMVTDHDLKDMRDDLKKDMKERFDDLKKTLK